MSSYWLTIWKWTAYLTLTIWFPALFGESDGDSTQDQHAPDAQSALGPQPEAALSVTIPEGADQPLAAALLNSHEEFVQQQAAIMAEIQRQRESQGAQPRSTSQAQATDTGLFGMYPVAGGFPTDSSAAGPSSTAAVIPSGNPSGAGSSDNGGVMPEDVHPFVDTCIVCMDAEKNWACIPYGHLAMCGACITRVKRQTGHCPVCKQKIKQIIQVYKA